MSGDTLGSVDEEAYRLARAMERARRAAHDDADAAPGADDETGSGGRPPLRVVPGCAECGAPVDDRDTESPRASCPWCRGSEWVRGAAPDLLRSMADASGLLAEGLRVLASAIEDRGNTTTVEEYRRPGPAPTDDTGPAPQRRQERA